MNEEPGEERAMKTAAFRVSVREIASWVDGRVVGDGERVVTGLGSLREAGPDQLSYVRDDVAARDAAASRAGALIAHRELEDVGAAQIVCADPSLAFVRALERFEAATVRRPEGVSDRASVAADAEIGEGASVGAFSVVEEGCVVGAGARIYPRVYLGRGVRVGAGSVIYPQVVIREGTEIGERCIIHSGAVIGDDGFGYIQREGGHVKVPQVGRVVLEDEVEVGSLVTIDRAALEETRIGSGVKIDNHSHIAHNVRIGENAMLVAYAKLAGSVRIGRNVLLAEDVGVSDHVSVGEGSVVGGGSKVYKDVPAGAVVWGSPARPIDREKRVQALLSRLPEIRDRIRALELRIAALESAGGTGGPAEDL
jgi:UDP-3-O-[3-hydroxymyristoyl] glucosamine N-acyltransferase